MSKTGKKDEKRLLVRLPGSTYKRLKSSAKKMNRSINSQIIAIIDGSDRITVTGVGDSEAVLDFQGEKFYLNKV